MGAARQASAINPQRAGTIRRVVRRGDTYLCGLCRSLYLNEADAQDCVKHCWSDVLALPAVILRRRGLRTVYRCRFCARDHDDCDLALQCAADCKRLYQQQFEAEQQASSLADTTAPATPHRQRARPTPVWARKALAPKAGSLTVHPAAAASAANLSEAERPTVTADIGTPPSQPAPPGPTTTATPASTPEAPAAAATPAAESGRKKRKASEAFYRDGARYVCSDCHEKYFTRAEVTKCFEGHE